MSNAFDFMMIEHAAWRMVCSARFPNWQSP